MRILALETSALRGTVAALEDDRVLGQSPLDPHQRSAQALAPAMAAQLQTVGWKPADVQLVAVTQGPGSFTGLRVGITAAKTFAYAVGAEVAGVDTLEVIAWQTPAEDGRLQAVLDAHRQQLFAATFSYTRGPGRSGWEPAEPTRIVDVPQWLDELTTDDWVSGSGLRRLSDRLPANVRVVEPSQWTPQAATVGQVAQRNYAAGHRDDLWTLAPRYYRLSAAEEKRQ